MGVTSTTAGASAQNATATTAISAAPAGRQYYWAPPASAHPARSVSFITIKNEGNVTLTASPRRYADLGQRHACHADAHADGGRHEHQWRAGSGRDLDHTASHTVTQADLDDGRRLSNSVAVTTAQTTTPHVDTATVSMVRQPAYSLTKTVDQASIAGSGTLEPDPSSSITVKTHEALTNLSINDQIRAAMACRVPPPPDRC